MSEQDEDIWQAAERIRREHPSDEEIIRSMPEPLRFAVLLILQSACCFMAYKYDDSEEAFQKGIRNINTAADLIKTFSQSGA